MIKEARTKATGRISSTKSRSGAPRRAQDAILQTATRIRRTWIVLGTLVIGLAITGALLKIMAPQPLTADPGLYAIGPDQSLDQLFDIPSPIVVGRWRSIYVHQSLTNDSDATSTATSDTDGMTDHFVVGNGNTIPNGAIQTGARWSHQHDAGTVPGVDIRPDCISVCVVGDFNQGKPSLSQQDRVVELISALQHKLRIDSDHIFFGLPDSQRTVAGVGGKFPTAAIRAQLIQ